MCPCVSRSARATLAAEHVTVARRDTGEKSTLGFDAVESALDDLLADIQRGLFDDAAAFRDENTHEAATYDELRAAITDAGGFVTGAWCGSADCEAKVKADTKATIRFLPLETEDPGAACSVCGRAWYRTSNVGRRLLRLASTPTGVLVIFPARLRAGQRRRDLMHVAAVRLHHVQVEEVSPGGLIEKTIQRPSGDQSGSTRARHHFRDVHLDRSLPLPSGRTSWICGPGRRGPLPIRRPTALARSCGIRQQPRRDCRRPDRPRSRRRTPCTTLLGLSGCVRAKHPCLPSGEKSSSFIPGPGSDVIPSGRPFRRTDSWIPVRGCGWTQANVSRSGT